MNKRKMSRNSENRGEGNAKCRKRFEEGLNKGSHKRDR
jgi:hypothetical protein